jgi:hypothetical protein
MILVEHNGKVRKLLSLELSLLNTSSAAAE